MSKISEVGLHVPVQVGGVGAVRPVAAPQKAAGPVGIGSSPSSGAADRTSVSSAGALIQEALNTPDVRADKVAALQQRIADGSYFVPASEVAGKLVDSLLR